MGGTYRRTKITDPQSNRKNKSKRGVEGYLSVVRISCKYCGHHKAFSKPRGVYCTKCKRKIER